MTEFQLVEFVFIQTISIGGLIVGSLVFIYIKITNRINTETKRINELVSRVVELETMNRLKHEELERIEKKLDTIVDKMSELALKVGHLETQIEERIKKPEQTL